jgi:hypothetical protein
MSMFREEATQMCKQAFRGWLVNVMQEGVRHDEVEPLAGQYGQFPRVGHPKPAFVAPLRAANKAFISIYYKVISMRKMARVGSRLASDVQYATHSLKIAMRGDGRELLLGEGRHPKPVNDRLSHDRF